MTNISEEKIAPISAAFYEGLLPLQEYADYVNITEEDALEKARALGMGCAVLYNALLKNASQVYGHKVVTDLLENKNLKFNVVMNADPSVADPEALIRAEKTRAY